MALYGPRRRAGQQHIPRAQSLGRRFSSSSSVSSLASSPPPPPPLPPIQFMVGARGLPGSRVSPTVVPWRRRATDSQTSHCRDPDEKQSSPQPSTYSWSTQRRHLEPLRYSAISALVASLGRQESCNNTVCPVGNPSRPPRPLSCARSIMEYGSSTCTTRRTAPKSTPAPNAPVATMMSASPFIHETWAAFLLASSKSP